MASLDLGFCDPVGRARLNKALGGRGEKGFSVIAKARITLPRPQPGLIPRPDLEAAAAHQVVLLAAGAGYGKSQLLAHWAQGHETAAFGLCSRLGETASSLLELLFAAAGVQDRFVADKPWQQQTDLFLEHLFGLPEGLLILDDIHHVESPTSDTEGCRLLLSYLLDYRPEQCRFILSGRTVPELADLEFRQMRGELAVLKGQQLALSAEQLEQLAPGQGEKLAELTSGWPLAAAVLMRHPADQWEAQRETLGGSLLKMATADLSPSAAEAVAVLGLMGWAGQHEITDPAVWHELHKLSQQGLLVHPLDKERVQLHPLFAEQYQAEAGDRVRGLAVEGLLASGRVWEALELTRSSDMLRERLLEHGEGLLRAGRHHLLARLLDRALEHPVLSRLRGEVNWRLGDPAAATEAFTNGAAQARELGHGVWEAECWAAAAGLYLDAVCPKEAAGYLRRAYRALGPGERREKARILERFAENAVNEGKARHASRYRRLAVRWDTEREEDLVVTARILLRSGRLAEARGGLEASLERGNSGQQSDGVLDGHRDPRLVLAYVHCLEGRPEKAEALAEEVLEHARKLDDRLTEAVALARLAHARLVKAKTVGEDGEVLSLYAQADALVRSLGMERLRAEMLMGQALYQSWRGNTPRAYEAAREGVDLTQRSGDVWMQTWLELVQAAAAADGGHPAALDLLSAAREAFRRCRDRFGFAVAEVWMARYGGGGDGSGRQGKALDEFPFLGQRANLFGPPPGSLPALPAPPEADSHRLQVFCLGTLSLLRDGEPVPAKAFKRKKARELFALLVAAPNIYFHREDLAAKLWPQADQKASLRDFRVALHALSDTLEPERPKNTTAFCIDRQEERYRLLSDRVELDTHRFEALLAQVNDVEGWERALKLYRGPFCEDYPYLESLSPVREKYDRLYLDLAENLAEAYLRSHQEGKAVELAQRMLVRDATWEPAYRLLMRGQAALGHDHLLPRTFTLCLETLEEELGVEPSEETFALARELLGEQLATIL
jgi:DNA-binding SARP family transcriptional activator